MAAMTEDRSTERKEGELIGYPVAASTLIYGGSLVMMDADGYAVPGADTVGCKFLGVAQDRVDNSDGVDGDKTVTVRRDSVHKLIAAGMAITDKETAVYLVDDQTVGVIATTTNDIICGIITEFHSATLIGVDIARRA